MTDESITWIVRFFFSGLGVAAIYWVVVCIRDAIKTRDQKSLLELEVKNEKIEKDNSSLSLDQLVDKSNSQLSGKKSNSKKH